MTIIQMERVFRNSGMDLPDPNESLSPDEVLSHYANSYPKLLGGKVVEIGLEGDRLVYELRERFGDKG